MTIKEIQISDNNENVVFKALICMIEHFQNYIIKTTLLFQWCLKKAMFLFKDSNKAKLH